jgi:hypothetical protein
MSIRHLTKRIRIASAIVAVSIGACGDPTGPDDVDGTYVLRSIGGEAMPITFVETETYQYRMLYDSLVLRTDGSATNYSGYAERTSSNGEWTIHRDTLHSSFRVSASMVFLTFDPCPVEMFCLSMASSAEYRRVGRMLVRLDPGIDPYRYEWIGPADE